MRKASVWMCSIVLFGCNSANDQQDAADASVADTSADAAAVNTPVESEQVPDIREEEISYEAGGTTLNGYLAYDANRTGERPGVLVVHEWWGHNDYVRERARMLAGMGYTAFALDMYGDDKLAVHPDDAQRFMQEVAGNMAVAKERFVAAKDLLEKHSTTDPSRTAAIGYCFGGAVVLNMARSGLNLDGVASFHGDLSTTSLAQPGGVHAKVLVAHGEADPFVTGEALAEFKSEMENAKVDLTYVGYPGVLHSFTNPEATAVGKKFNIPLAYDEAADRDSWQRLEEFLAGVFIE